MKHLKIIIGIIALLVLALLGWIIGAIFKIEILDNVSLSLAFIGVGSFCLYFKEVPLRGGGSYKSNLVSIVVGIIFLLAGIINLLELFFK